MIVQPVVEPMDHHLVKQHLADPDDHGAQRVQNLPGGGAHVLGDGDPREVEEGNGDHDQHHVAVDLGLVVHLREGVCKTTQ